MARQPLPRKYHRGPWSLGASQLDKRPAHLAAIGSVITRWTDVETEMALVLRLLLGTRSEAAVALYTSLRQQRSRTETIATVASSILDSDEQELLAAILIVYGQTESARNDIAHGCYGSCDDIEDGIIWLPTKDNANWTVSVWHKDEAGSRSGDEHAELAKKMLVYKLSDLKAVVSEIDDTWKLVFNLISYLQTRSLGPDLKRAERFHRLRSEPRVSKALAQMRDRKQRSPQSQP